MKCHKRGTLQSPLGLRKTQDKGRALQKWICRFANCNAVAMGPEPETFRRRRWWRPISWASLRSRTDGARKVLEDGKCMGWNWSGQRGRSELRKQTRIDGDVGLIEWETTEREPGAGATGGRRLFFLLSPLSTQLRTRYTCYIPNLSKLKRRATVPLVRLRGKSP